MHTVGISAERGEKNNEAMEYKVKVKIKGRSEINLVGLFFLIWDYDELKIKGIIRGQLTPEHYLVNAIDLEDRKPGVVRIVHISEMATWQFWEEESDADLGYKDFREFDKTPYRNR